MNNFYLKAKSSLSDQELNNFGISQKIIIDISRKELQPFLRLPDVKKILLEIFSDNGFILRQRIHKDYGIFISGSKEKSALCIQMDHKAGWYYDLVKCEYLHRKGMIENVSFVLPSLNLEKFCKSSGTANFEHISKMNKIFKDIFSFRINIISIDIKEGIIKNDK